MNGRFKIADIEWMHIGRELGVQTGGRFQAIVFKIKRKAAAHPRPHRTL